MSVTNPEVELQIRDGGMDRYRLRGRLCSGTPFMAVGVSLALAAAGSHVLVAAVPRPHPDFGPNVFVFDPSIPPATIQAQIDKVYAVQKKNEFGSERNAFLFVPGEYKVDIPIGYYTEVIGLGASPNDVSVTGDVHSDGNGRNNNALVAFWRAAEGISVSPAGGTMQWAVSQAAPFRRMHVRGDLVLHQKGGWVSGGWMSDSLVDGNVGSGPQQQWISRNSEWGSWTGANWNMVFVGVPHRPGRVAIAGLYQSRPNPIVREKPFLQVDTAGTTAFAFPNSVPTAAESPGATAPRAADRSPFSGSILRGVTRIRQRHQRAVGQRQVPLAHAGNL